ncbi:chemerin-like receptor 1 [Amia ocellicauda]|uniref:chemerin-like receptor 1 n=1 Tax=Amia ocellicauda TaxID=2972642 RepID=UPI003464D6EC
MDDLLFNTTATPSPSNGSLDNNTTSDYYEDYDYDYEEEIEGLGEVLKVMSLVVYSLAFLLGVLGNGLVIWVTGFQMKKTVNTVWFLNLAVADFLFTAFLPLSVAYTAMDFHWPFGRFMCKLNSTLAFLNMFASVYILAVISMDRCVAVARPVWAQNHRSVRGAWMLSLGVWVLACFLSAPYFVFRDTAPSERNPEVINCFNNFAFPDNNSPTMQLFRHRAMIVTRVTLGFALPFSVIVGCYGTIVCRLRHNQALASRSGRALRIIMAVVAAFFLCWAPYHAFSLLEMFNHMAAQASPALEKASIIGIPVATSLAFLNSCLNPLLYVCMGQDFKDKVRRPVLAVLESAFTEEGYSHSSSHSHSALGGRSIRASYWVLACFLSAPYFVFRDTAPSERNPEVINCFNNFAFPDNNSPTMQLFRHRAMIVTRVTLGFALPFSVIVGCYGTIVCRLRHNQALASRSGRALRIIMAVVAAFFLCWAPYHAFSLLEMFNHMAAQASPALEKASIIGIPVATSLAFLNSCLNPLLYVCMGQDFKDKVRRPVLAVLESAFTEEGYSHSSSHSHSALGGRSIRACV